MNRWILALGVFVAMFVLGFVLWPELQDPPEREQAASEGAKPTAPLPGSSDTKPTRARIPRVPKVVRNTAPTASVAPLPSVAPEAADEDVATGGVDPTIPLTAAGISSVVDKMRPSIEACVDTWTDETPEIQGRVLLAFQIGPEGIQDAWIMEHESVPTGILGCFSSAVYEQRWPAAPDGVEVTMPFEVDAGLEDDGKPTELLDRR